MKFTLLNTISSIVGILTLPFILAFLYVSIKRPFWVVAALAVYLPFEEFVLKWVPDSLYVPFRFLGEALILLLFGVFFIDRVFVKKRWPKTPIDLPVILLLITIVFSAIVNHIPPMVAILGAKNLIRYIALFYLIILIRPSDQQIVQLLRVLLVVAIFQAGIAVFQSLGGKPAYDFFAAKDVVIGGQVIRSGGAQKLASGSYHTMVFGTMGRYNFLGNYLAMWLGIVGAFLISKYRIIRIHIWYAPLLLVALLLTYSRMSWIALALAGILIFSLSKKNKPFAYALVFFVVLFLLAGWLIIGNDIDTHAVDIGMGSPFSRILDLFSSDYLTVLFTGGRGYSYFTIMPAAFQLKPILGFGPGSIASDVSNLISFASIAAELNLDNPYALRFLGDAGYATISVQLGGLGLIAVLGIFWQLFWADLQLLKRVDVKWRPLAVAYMAILVMTVVFNLASFSLIYRVPSYYFWLFSAIIVLQNLKSKNAYDNFQIYSKTEEQS